LAVPKSIPTAQNAGTIGREESDFDIFILKVPTIHEQGFSVKATKGTIASD
jgi:hypothetical protein